MVLHYLGEGELQSHKRGEVKRSGSGLENGGQSTLQVSERPLPRVVIFKVKTAWGTVVCMRPEKVYGDFLYA